jgi:hypothetical protein
MGVAPPTRHAPPCIVRNAGARCFHQAHGFRIAATSDGAGTEEGEPGVPLKAADPVTTRTQAGAPP